MCFRRKKTTDEELASNSALIERNAMQIGFLITLADSKDELIDKLKEAQVKIRYLSPTLDKSAAHLDKKIENRLGDIKIALSKAKNSNNYSYSTELIDGLMLLVAERKSL